MNTRDALDALDEMGLHDRHHRFDDVRDKLADVVRERDTLRKSAEDWMAYAKSLEPKKKTEDGESLQDLVDRLQGKRRGLHPLWPMSVFLGLSLFSAALFVWPQVITLFRTGR